MTDDKRMTRAEAVILCRFAKACCPQQTFDEYTPDAWFELLGDLLATDCKQAVINVVKRQPFVSPSEIRKEVKRVRWKRLEDFGPYDVDTQILESNADPTVYREWMRRMNRQIADGEITRENYQPPAIESWPKRDVQGLIAGTFRRPEDVEPDPGAPGPCTKPGCEDPWCEHGGAE